ncbi:hypothetical protein N752_05645 [Desulforamulus aquiferis]|nr:hypothetical protein N752_05645 [Desulforamulus aquiferis]
MTGYTILDPIIAIGVGLLIVKAAVDLIKDSLGSMLDTSLPRRKRKSSRLSWGAIRVSS